MLTPQQLKIPTPYAGLTQFRHGASSNALRMALDGGDQHCNVSVEGAPSAPSARSMKVSYDPTTDTLSIILRDDRTVPESDPAGAVRSVARRYPQEMQPSGSNGCAGC